MAKRVRKTEQEYIRARNAAMRSIQRTNRAFGSNIKLSDIVDVPTPAQARRMSAAELRAATRRLNEARRTDEGEKVTFVPTGTGGVTRVLTKDYNAAMSNLAKGNKALEERRKVIEGAEVPKEALKGARPVSMRDVTSGRTSKIQSLETVDPFTAFIGGKATGNVDEIVKRFHERGRIYAERPRKWKEQDDRMKGNFIRTLEAAGRSDIIEKLNKLSRNQLLWAVYERNFGSYITSLALSIDTNEYRGPEGSIISRELDEIAHTAIGEIEAILDTAANVRFTE